MTIWKKIILKHCITHVVALHLALTVLIYQAFLPVHKVLEGFITPPICQVSFFIVPGTYHVRRITVRKVTYNFPRTGRDKAHGRVMNSFKWLTKNVILSVRGCMDGTKHKTEQKMLMLARILDFSFLQRELDVANKQLSLAPKYA